MTEHTPVYIKEVGVTNYKCFTGENRFKFADENDNWYRWTVFLGDNNTGKTNLLKAIACLEPDYDLSEGFFHILGDYLFEKKLLECTIGVNTIPSVYDNIPEERTDSDFDLYTKLRADNLFFNTPYLSGNATTVQECKDFLIYGYGIVRHVENKGINSKAIKLSNASNLFDNTNLLNFEDWLFQLDYTAKNDSAPIENRQKAIERRDLLISVLKGDLFPEIEDIRFISDAQLNNYIEFQTKDGWHKLSQLGYGYQATLSWMVDFCKKLFDRYSNSKNPLKEPAILLIDEIDLHLHPQWQRSIIKYLSDIFTQTQFIVTTHSPFIIQSMEKVNLYALQREGDHTNVKHFGVRSFIGWRIEEILSEIMGLEDNIQTDIYQELMKKFQEAIDADDYKSGREAYDKLMEILHPQSEERKLLDIQLSQLVPDDQA